MAEVFTVVTRESVSYNEVTWQVRNTGRQYLEVDPMGAEIWGALVAEEDKAARSVKLSKRGGNVLVPLPLAAKSDPSFIIRLTYSQPLKGTLGFYSTVEPSVPEPVGVTVGETTWEVWLPEEYNYRLRSCNMDEVIGSTHGIKKAKAYFKEADRLLESGNTTKALDVSRKGKNQTDYYNNRFLENEKQALQRQDAQTPRGTSKSNMANIVVNEAQSRQFEAQQKQIMVQLNKEIENTSNIPRGTSFDNLGNKNRNSASCQDAYGIGGGAAGQYGQRWSKKSQERADRANAAERGGRQRPRRPQRGLAFNGLFDGEGRPVVSSGEDDDRNFFESVDEKEAGEKRKKKSVSQRGRREDMGRMAGDKSAGLPTEMAGEFAGRFLAGIKTLNIDVASYRRGTPLYFYKEGGGPELRIRSVTRDVVSRSSRILVFAALLLVLIVFLKFRLFLFGDASVLVKLGEGLLFCGIVALGATTVYTAIPVLVASASVLIFERRIRGWIGIKAA